MYEQDGANDPSANDFTSPVEVPTTSGRHGAIRADRQLVPAGRPQRQVTTARPLRAEDTALVARITQVLETVDAVDLKTAVHQSMKLKVVRPETVVVPAPSIPAATVMRNAAPMGSDHRLAPYLRSIGWVVIICLVIGVVEAVAPIGGGVQTARFVPIAAQLAGNPTLNVSTGPWATGSGGTTTLGFGGGAGPGVQAPGTAGVKVIVKAIPQPTPVPVRPAMAGPGVLAAPFQPWPPTDPYMFVPGHPAFGMSDPSGYYWWAFGQCTWWAQYKRQDENLTHLGNALYWATGAAQRGLRVGTVPVAGATVVLQPGWQGAGGDGHVAHVEAVYPDGWFLVSEMNYYWNGGGWGRVDYRYMHTGPGISFIY